jgi:hypothetical protein
MELNCPLPAELTDIPSFDCGVRFDQIVKMAFQREGNSFPSLSGSGGITVQASWTPLLAASDDTKIVVSNYFAGLVIPGSEGQFEGGNDNTTISGVRLYKGENGVTVTGVMRNLPSDVRAALRAYSQESLSSIGATNLTAYFFTRPGLEKIIALKVGTTYKGIPIYNFRIASPDSQGFNADNIINFSFDLLPDWDENVEVLSPAFNPLSL